MMLEIVKATNKELDNIVKIYEDVCDFLENNINYPKWKKGIYPTYNDALKGYQENSLYVLKSENRIIGTMILNSEYEPGYNQGNWTLNVDDKEILVIHTLTIHPDFYHQKFALKLVEYAIMHGRKYGYKTIRIDVTESNHPALSLYQKFGFKCVGKVDLNRGCLFYLYEYIL